MSEAVARDTAFIDAFSDSPEPPEAAPTWIARLRSRAHERFLELGLPHTRMEDWRQTSVAPIARTSFRQGRRLATRDGNEAFVKAPFADVGLPRLTILDGRVSPELSTVSDLPKGVRVLGLTEGLVSVPERIEPVLGQLSDWEKRAFTALSTARMEDGALVLVDPGVRVETPLQILYLLTARDEPAAWFPRTVVVAGQCSEIGLVETYAGGRGSASLSVAVTEVLVGANAAVRHVRVQDEGPAAFHISESAAHLERDARYLSLNVCLGARLTRNDIAARMDGEGAEAVLDGLYVARGEQHVDNQTLLDHARPNCPSHELYKGILCDSARAVFNGRIIVRQDAQKTNAIQNNRNLLLSDEALVHTRPQLEIYADDVKCTHGATIGQLDADALFYMRSRGIAAGEARRLLIKAFASDLLEEMPVEELRERLTREILSRLPES
jgi:Fe-S cluster assembly protein SufD